ncbi:MAG: transcription antitermination factor NusB [Helicobacter sp.]|nr:transcription antitermination factor NusB [Helicobacter sp.]
MATRSQAREAVIQLLYAYGSGNDGISKFIEQILEEQKIKNTQKEFAQTLFFGVLENLDEIDKRIKHQLKSWDFSRIGDIERSILRLGTYEIIFSKIDKAVVINEALEIAKNFGNESSAKFINGVLDGISKNIKITLEDIEKELESQAKLESKQLESDKKEIPAAPKQKFKQKFKKRLLFKKTQQKTIAKGKK